MTGSARRDGAPDQHDDLAALEAGLDALDSPPPAGESRARRVWHSVWPPVVAVSLLLLAWEVAFRAELKPTYALPSPADVALTFGEKARSGDLLEAVLTSLERGGLGFALALLVGTPLGAVIARFRSVRRGIGPIVSGLQNLPSVAWVPAAIIFFGLTDTAIYAVVLLGAVPSIANGMVSGLDQVPPLYRRVGQVLGARGLSQARFVLLPAALPGYLAGLRQGWAFSWRSLMAAELITYSPDLGFGLGQLLDQGRQLQDMAAVFTGILAILVVGIVVELAVFSPVERGVLRRRGLLV